MVLPRGRIKGFCILKAAVALESMQKQQCADFIRVEGTEGTLLWHEFEKWNGDSSFIFKAGLSGDLSNFEYNIHERKITSSSPSSRLFIGENSSGKLEIHSQ